LEELDNVILTPHIAAFTREAQLRTIEAVAADVDAVLSGGSALNAVNSPQKRGGAAGQGT
jgi:D-3-phosphoglycerate dehydrogenase / 2-oxoglutarate reductase